MSLRLKTILGVALIEAVLLALLLSLTLNYLKTTNYEGLTKRGESTARLFASTVKDAVLSWDLASLEAFTSELMTNPDLVYVRVINRDGKVLALKGDNTYLQAFHKPEVSAEYVSDGIYDVSHSIQESGIVYGAVQIGFDMSALNLQIQQARKWSGIIVIGEMTLVALFSYVLGAYLTRRLTHLQVATEHIASGRRDINLAEHGGDEIAHVSRAFNKMVTKLSKSEHTTQSYQKQLEVVNASLENKVKTRTNELRAKNIHLEKTNSELKETQAKLIQTEKLAAIGTMAAGYAHEINNPLATIDSNLQSAQSYLVEYQGLIEAVSRYPDDDVNSLALIKRTLTSDDFSYLQQDLSECIQDARDNALRVKAIIAGLKNYSHFEKTNMSQGVEINEVVNLSLKECQFELNTHINASLNLGQLDSVSANTAELQQAIVYIIKNAYQALRNEEDGKVDISTYQQDNTIAIAIRDNGCGMKTAQLNKAFDPFYTTRTIGDGSGLGLTSARNIVQRHKGKITIESTEGIGTTVTLLLPVEGS